MITNTVRFFHLDAENVVALIPTPREHCVRHMLANCTIITDDEMLDAIIYFGFGPKDDSPLFGCFDDGWTADDIANIKALVLHNINAHIGLFPCDENGVPEIITNRVR